MAKVNQLQVILLTDFHIVFSKFAEYDVNYII